MTQAPASPRLAGNLLWLGFFLFILASWGVLWGMAGMSGLDPFGRVVGPNMMPMVAVGPIFGMWSLMMAAMMLPTLVPTLRTYERLIRPGVGTRPGWLGVLGGFFGVWLAFAAGIALLQAQLASAGLIDQLGAVGSRRAAGALLVLAGLWQYTRAKAVCHGVCIGPMAWFLGRWRPGLVGGARMGAGLGAFCVGCCWTYMALGFAGGTMNLSWMGIATLLMVLEKLPQIGLRVLRPSGALMVAGGIAWGIS